MAWRFKASKYKNAAPIVPKFEQHIRDLAIGSYRSHGNFIAASAAFMAFNWDTSGSNLAVLPLNAKGRQNKANVPLIYAHSEMVTDFQFSPFDDGLLATGSQDSYIKLWRIPEEGLTPPGISNPELTLPEQPRRVETINFHPTADCILASSSYNSLTVWDIAAAKNVYDFYNHEDEVQSVSWHQTGHLLATQCKDRQLRILDPRQDSNNPAMQCDSHQGIKDSRVIWVGHGDRVLTTGFSGDRLREINIRDIRNLSEPQQNLTLDMSSGLLLPLFDPDTNMCFLCGKGDRNIQFIEVANTDPFIVEGLKYSGDQTKGACLVPKRVMNVMQGEVNRVLQMSNSSIIPVTWQVPRKSYRDYHADIYPETFGMDPGMGPENWINGENVMPEKINLDPKKRPKQELIVFREKIADRQRLLETKATKQVDVAATKDIGKENNTNSQEKLEENKNDVEFSKSHVFVKPYPKPRITPRANSTSSDSNNCCIDRDYDASPVPRPRVTNHDGVNNLPARNKSESISSSDDSLDEGLAFLRRQPSIKDRRKLFEANSNTEQDNVPKKAPLVRVPSDEENKENKLKEKMIVKSDEAEDSKKSEEKVELRQKNIFLANDLKPEQKKTEIAPVKRPISKAFGRVSKFKHLKGDVMLSGRFDNLKNLSKTCPAECNFVCANSKRIAVPLTGPGGKIAVLESSKPGRIPDGVMPVLINGTSVMDFCFDPFDDSRLLCGCDDGQIRIWTLPEKGLVQQINKPEVSFSAHVEKIQILQFHPLAKNIILTAAFDRSVKIWNLDNFESGPQMELEGHGEQLYSAKFSQCGRFVATVSKDGKIRIFDPRKSSQPLVQGGDIIPKKGARILWVLNGEYLLVSSFSRQSERQISLWRTSDMTLMNTVVLDVSPAILIPHYDEDSNTLFLTGKGESTVTTFEVSTDSPHFFQLSSYKPIGLHQGFAFLPKKVCDVKKVEFARAFRLTNTTIEPISFTVPRVKTNFFQDDLFPPTRILWESSLSAEEWCSGVDRPAALLDLKPDDLPNLNASSNTNRPVSAITAKSGPTNSMTEQAAIPSSKSLSFPAGNSLQREEAKKKEMDIEASVSNIVGDVSDELEQDKMEGVEEKEWDEDTGSTQLES